MIRASLILLGTSYNGLHRADGELQRRADGAHSGNIMTSRQGSQRRSAPGAADDKLQRRDPGAGVVMGHDRNATGSPMATIGRAASQKGVKKCRSVWQQHLKTTAPRPATRRKMFGRTAIATRPTHTKWVGTTQGLAHTERALMRGYEAENLGWRSPSLPRRVRGAAALPTPDDMPSEVLATGRGARWRWKRSSSPRRRRWNE